MFRPTASASFAVLLPLFTAAGCTRPAANPRPAEPAAGVVLPGGEVASGDDWYDDRLREDDGVVAGPPVAQDAASVTRVRGGQRVTASGEVRDTLDRRTYRETVRSTE